MSLKVSRVAKLLFAYRKKWNDHFWSPRNATGTTGLHQLTSNDPKIQNFKLSTPISLETQTNHEHPTTNSLQRPIH